MEIKARIPNSEYSISEEGIVLDGNLRVVNRYSIDGIKKRDFYDLEINNKVTRFSHRSIIKRVISVEYWDELFAKARTERREKAAEYERLRLQHREAILAQPEEIEYKI